MRASKLVVTGAILVVLLLLSLGPGLAQEQPTLPLGGAFTFQGFLSDAGSPINDTCDFRFTLWDAATGGIQVGPTLDQTGVAVEQGRFTVLLDFGDVFDGTALWLETGVRCTGEPAYTTLAPRQELTAAPYALGAAWTGLYNVPPGFADDIDNDVLGGLSCTGGQVAKWDGTAWSCAPDDSNTYSAGAGLVLTGTVFSADTAYLQRRAQPCGTGYAIQQINQDGSVVCAFVDNTTYDAGLGLILSGTTFLVNSSIVQLRVAGACGAGSSIRQVNQDGSVVCEPDDDTNYGAGIGLYLAGTTFGITTTYRLPQACTDGYIARWNDTLGRWECAVDDNTTYTAGNQLTLTGTTFNVVEGAGSDLDADLLDGLQGSAYQLRVSGACADGFSIRVVNADGTVVCEPDDNTTYSAGTGLILSGTTFFPDTAYLQRRVAPCGPSFAIQSVNQDGSVVCQLVDNTTYNAGIGLYLAGTTFGITLTYRLPQACSATQVAKWNGTAWVCADDNNTTYTNGTGLGLVGTVFSVLASYQLPQGCSSTQIARWDGSGWNCSFDVGATDHGALQGLDDDDHPQYFALAQYETVTGIPNFNGGTSDVTPPFTVDSSYPVVNLNADLLDGHTTGTTTNSIPVNDGNLNATLNADLLDGQHAAAFAPGAHNHWGQSWTGGGTGLTLSGGTVGLSGSGSSTAVYGSGGTYGVWGMGTTYGVWGTTAVAAGSGVYGSNTAGGYGVNGSSTGTAVRADGGTYGVHADGSSTAVYAQGGTYGLYGSGTYGAYGTGTYGVYGSGTYGVWGTGSSTGVYGASASTAVRADGGTYGVYADGTSYGTYSLGGAYGVYGNGTTYGLYGASASTAVRADGGTYGVYADGTSYGTYSLGGTYGIYASGTSTAAYAGGGTYGVYATGTSTAVYAYTAGQAAIYGNTTYAVGNGYGVWGNATGGTAQDAGVYGRSTSNSGYGLAGHNYWGGVGVGAWSYSGDIYRGYSGDWPGGTLQFYVNSVGGVYANDNFYTFKLLSTPDGGKAARTLYTPQNPEPWSEDAGTAQLVDGQATVTVEALFAQTVDLAGGYHVYLTPLGDCQLYVAEKTATAFTVRAMGGQTCSIAFDYRILAKPQGTAGQRMEVLDVDLGTRTEKTEETP